MKRVLFILALSVGASLVASAQTEDHHDEHTVTSSALPTARFQIIQSTLTAKVTFKLDKAVGSVWMLVRDPSDNSVSWESIPVLGLTSGSRAGHFQLFLSGLLASNTFVVDTDTGATWQYAEAKDPKSGERTSVFQSLP